MPSQTPNMGLWRWDNANDGYDHNQLAANWNVVDAHDHTGGNKGLKIATAALNDAAVTNPKIGAQAVTGSNIANNTILPANCDTSVFLATAPLGTVHWWWVPPNASDGLPAGWLVCDGSVVSAGNHGFATGGQSITLPDIRNRIPLGAALTGFGDGDADDPPHIGAANGSHTIDFSHDHCIPGHRHHVPPHSHEVEPHEHGISDHEHIITTDGAHDHKFNNGLGTFVSMQAQGVNSSIATTFQALTIPSLNAGSSTPATVQLETRGAHNHGGSTGGVFGAIGPIVALTDAQAPNTNLVDFDSEESEIFFSLFGLVEIVDIRPRWIGLLPIIRVKY